MPETTRRLNVTLDPASAAKLAKMADRTHVNKDTLAGLLLSRALDEDDSDERRIPGLLDGLQGALERAQQGVEDAKAGLTVTLDEL